MRTYADNATIIKLSRTAIDAMLPYMDEWQPVQPVHFRPAGQGVFGAYLRSMSPVWRNLERGKHPHII